MTTGHRTFTPVDQTVFKDAARGIYGNCVQASVASLLGLPLERVPHFTAVGRAKGGHEELELEAFVSALGFDLLRLKGNHVFDGYYLAGGPTVRGTHHMVVMRAGALAHDPHPSRAGLEAIEHVWVLIPFNPAQAVGVLDTPA